jgi:hypothetical protein
MKSAERVSPPIGRTNPYGEEKPARRARKASGHAMPGMALIRGFLAGEMFQSTPVTGRNSMEGAISLRPDDPLKGEVSSRSLFSINIRTKKLHLLIALLLVSCSGKS